MYVVINAVIQEALFMLYFFIYIRVFFEYMTNVSCFIYIPLWFMSQSDERRLQSFAT